ncbi:MULTISPECIES: DUF2854 domain-containing protein [unclassified Roseofilum]|uniref:DUF2854 domain-containing protein n=1 Tax=unclassified Roseofilum TaxID=2620099 RepID=UPI000E9EBD16|nr:MULTISPECIES: DUF2854 domain-containing protein [unclassified Roseofilum]HBQ99333.1 hypothetical protein [Cyanobacteria bacterium UBA11691]MBP0009310.1 DUF2854 domain-containing protein [Roseofilum sp. Belize Diploria]MBP0015194.1 DUF2854 domain-containing protein [Roseofilum sp. SID3]MBP0024470.1 DUF2854 domain-containing protein [Roseofilum sp. SID2]MBP0033730.1 DUF2854 domain-containing protein [Roseofilum sp. Belize BBD 4]
MLRKISLGTVGLYVGGLLTIGGFVAYFTNHPTLNLAGFFYGIPLLLGGLALKASELKPVPVTQETSAEVLALRDRQGTSTQLQVWKDVTRYRYGQEAHLDESLKSLGLSPTDEERPLLIGIREVAVDSSYALVLEFESPFVSLDAWQEKREKIEYFFGPGLRVEVAPQEGEEDCFDIFLIAVGEPARVS